MWDPQFMMAEFIAGVRERIVSEDQAASLFNEMQLILFGGVGFGLLMTGLFIFYKFFTKIRKVRVKIRGIFKKTFWNGMIISF